METTQLSLFPESSKIYRTLIVHLSCLRLATSSPSWVSRPTKVDIHDPLDVIGIAWDLWSSNIAMPAIPIKPET